MYGTISFYPYGLLSEVNYYYFYYYLSVILDTTEAVMTHHSIYKPSTPKQISTTVRGIQKILFHSTHYKLVAW